MESLLGAGLEHSMAIYLIVSDCHAVLLMNISG